MSKSTGVTTDEFGVPTSKPQSKVIASTAGAGVGAAITTIAVYLIETLGKVEIPEAVEGAGLVLISAGIAFLAGYIKRPTGIS